MQNTQNHGFSELNVLKANVVLPLLAPRSQFGRWGGSCLIFRILAVFGAVFCIEKLQRLEETCLASFYPSLFFHPKGPFCKVYSPCLVAIFGNFQNGLIFRILAPFWSHFLHRTTAMCCRNVFGIFLCISNFWPKVTILQGLCFVAIFGNFQNALIFRG